jgi:stage II sporulation protein AB (anti-sigma F factor)
MTIRLYAPAWAEIIIKDRGCGIPDVRKAREPMFTTGGSERSGMGFTIMESFMDYLSVRSTPGKGTTVKMRKLLDLRPEK